MIDFYKTGKFVPKHIQDRVLEKILVGEDNINKAVISRLRNISKMKKKLKSLRESVHGDYWEWASPKEIEVMEKIRKQIPVLEKSIDFKENDNLFNLLKSKATINYSDSRNFSDNDFVIEDQFETPKEPLLTPLQSLGIGSVLGGGTGLAYDWLMQRKNKKKDIKDTIRRGLIGAGLGGLGGLGFGMYNKSVYDDKLKDIQEKISTLTNRKDGVGSIIESQSIAKVHGNGFKDSIDDLGFHKNGGEIMLQNVWDNRSNPENKYPGDTEFYTKKFSDGSKDVVVAIGIPTKDNDENAMVSIFGKNGAAMAKARGTGQYLISKSDAQRIKNGEVSLKSIEDLIGKSKRVSYKN